MDAKFGNIWKYFVEELEAYWITRQLCNAFVKEGVLKIGIQRIMGEMYIRQTYEWN
jgi:hypothetical protein